MIDILIVAFLVGNFCGVLVTRLLYNKKKVGKIFMMDDPDNPDKPYLFLELYDSTKIEKIRRTDSVLLEIDKKSSH